MSDFILPCELAEEFLCWIFDVINENPVVAHELGESHILHVHASVNDHSRSTILFRAQESCARSALKC